MRKCGRQSGLTLTELLVTVAIAAVLLALAVPAAKQLTESLQNSAGTQGLIAAALSNARAIAVREGHDAGVRFQRAADGRTYMVFIVQDEPANMGGLANGFRVVDGRKPIALPEDAGVLVGGVYSDVGLTADKDWTNANTLSVVFDKTGKLVIHPVRVRNKNGQTNDTSSDSVFNTKVNVDAGRAMFYQDDYPAPSIPANPNLGLAEEDSVNGLRIYDKKAMAEVPSNQRWSGYLGRLNTLMVSPYTGELIGN